MASTTCRLLLLSLLGAAAEQRSTVQFGNTTVEYFAYGTRLATVVSHHQAAVKAFMRVSHDFTGAPWQDFRVIVYEPTNMTTEDVSNCIDNFCAYAVGPNCPTTKQDVLDGNLCGGVCGERPILVFKVDPSHPDAAQVGEAAVHEVNHMFQIQNGAPAFANCCGDAGEDWREQGPRWWREGTATWLGDRLLRAYPEVVGLPDPKRTNFGRTLTQNCAGFKATSGDRGLRLTNAIQASDKPWKELWIQKKTVYEGRDMGMQDAYYPMVYEGGYCASEFILSTLGVDTQSTDGMLVGMRKILQVEAGAKRLDNWETSFLHTFGSLFDSMQQFYEKFEAAEGASGAYTYAAPAAGPECTNACPFLNAGATGTTGSPTSTLKGSSAPGTLIVHGPLMLLSVTGWLLMMRS